MRRAVALLLTLALAAAAVGTVSATTTTIDADHQLASDDAVAEYQENGTVSAELTRIDATVTIADESENAGMNGTYLDAGTTYLRIDYDESVARTLRLYFPSEYFSPRVKRGLEPAGTGPNAEITTVRDGEMTAVTVDVSGETDTTYGVSAVSGTVWSVRSSIQDQVENVTGWSVPTLSSDEQWRYVGEGNYSTASPRTINDTGLTVQYEVERDNTTEWLPVPECKSPESQRVCALEDGNQTVLMSGGDAPRVRYRSGTDLFSTGGSIINDLMGSVDRAIDSAQRLLGGL